MSINYNPSSLIKNDCEIRGIKCGISDYWVHIRCPNHGIQVALDPFCCAGDDTFLAYQPTIEFFSLVLLYLTIRRVKTPLTERPFVIYSMCPATHSGNPMTSRERRERFCENATVHI